MKSIKRPYLIVPKLIEQPTWGGSYIANIKNWRELSLLDNKKIGQSYELFNQSKLLINIIDTEDKNFFPELGEANSDEVFNQTNYKQNEDYLNLEQVTDFKQKILLIKINQSKGNSFQLHVKNTVRDNRWIAKPESWLFLENGYITFGLKKDQDVLAYQKCCEAIDQKMKELSLEITNKKISIENAKKESNDFIKKLNPWQYVNVLKVPKDFIVDPSAGGIHHSWEEDDENFPEGNVIYEIQKNVMDPISTIRSFDKGKFKTDGSIREIHIKDYFKYLDTSEFNNNPNNFISQPKSQNLIKTDNYCLDLLEVDNHINIDSKKTYVHLFVRDGKVKVSANGYEVTLSRGFSCFLPEDIESIDIINLDQKKSFVLKTYLPC